MADPEDILNLIRSSPGKKAKEIAEDLHVDKKLVNSILYGALRGKVTQDRSYRWWPSEVSAAAQMGPSKAEKLDTPLARLCGYYLECITRDDQAGLSVFAASSYGNLDYAELSALPQIADDTEDVFQDERFRQVFSRIARDRKRLNLVLGYPVLLHRIRSKKGWEGILVQPILLFRFEEGLTGQAGRLVVAEEPPMINFEAVRSLSAADRGTSIVEEIVQLSEELGLADAGLQPPEIEEIIPRLREIRAEWDWKEEPDLYHLALTPPISEISEPGIYNRGVLVAAERSPYTQGLEIELAKLQSVTETAYANTALGAWLGGFQPDAQFPQALPLLEVLPLNSEQRTAVLSGLNNALTVITGPPGTGKSQVVTSLLINSAWQGQTVLFASKNNKAVDVVETRINSLGGRPVLLRLGANEYQSRLAEYLISLLAATASGEDERTYRDYMALHDRIRHRFEELNAQLTGTLALRNEVDELEQSAESVRRDIGPDLFRSFRTFNYESSSQEVESFKRTAQRADKSRQGLLTRIFWWLAKRRRYAELAHAARAFLPVATCLGITLPSGSPGEETIEEWIKVAPEAEKRISMARIVRRYFEKLDKLTSSKTLEDLSREHSRLVEDLAEISDQLWRLWLKLQPSRMTSEDRKLLRDYGAVLKLIVAANEERRQAGRQIFARYHALFPKISRILPCWAVTSLSAHGRVPFDAAFFDLLIIDEASQCDIASALPLLFRAKRAVIIGDPKQLRHISSLIKDQDRLLLEKNGLAEGYAGWAYSVNSLFDLASGLCRSEDIVELRDHHRSHADIIEFSNRHFYEGRLRVATKYDCLRRTDSDGPAVRWLNVAGAVVRPPSGGALNEDEAKAVVKEIARLVLDQGYAGTIGVVSPFRAQANRIRDLVYQHPSLGPRVASLDFLVDTVHRFQGDERDVIIFSPVVSSRTPAGALIFLRNNPNLFNVAVTRARAALIVVGDLQACVTSDVDYLAKFAQYVQCLGTPLNPEGPEEIVPGPDYPPVAHPERVSEWERVFYRALYAAGFRPIPQYEVEKYTLDFALLNGQKMLDIEIDGERYHRKWDGELCRRDQIRNQRLFELGWDVMRFWVYQVRDDLDACLERIRHWWSQA